MWTRKDIFDLVKTGDAKAARRLLSRKPQLVHAHGDYEFTPLHMAARADVARVLIDAGAKVDALGWMGATPLHKAAGAGRADVAEVLIAAGADVNARRTERRDVPLHWAGNAAVARLLIAHAADVHSRDWSGRTPLHWAAQAGRADVVEVLLQNGASVDARADLNARTAAERLLSLARRAIGADETLRDHSTLETPLHLAARDGHLEPVRILLAHGAAIDSMDWRGRTPLHDAAYRGQDSVIQLLLDHGADPVRRSEAGFAPLHEAWQHPATVQLLRCATPADQLMDIASSRGPEQDRLPILRICSHPRRPEAITVAKNALLSKWVLEGAQPKLQLSIQTPHPAINDVAVLPGAAHFALAIRDGPIEIRAWSDLTVQHRLAREASAIDFSPDGHWLAVADTHEKVHLIDPLSGRVADSVDGGETTAAVRFDPASRLLACACSFQGGACLDVCAVGADGKLAKAAEFDRNAVRTGGYVDELIDLNFSSDGRHLALFETGRHDIRRPGWRGNIVLFDVRAQVQVWSAAVDHRATGDFRSLIGAGHPMGYSGRLAFVGDRIACGTTRGWVLLFARDSGKLVESRRLHQSAAVLGIAWDPFNDRLWAGLENGEVRSLEV